MRPHLFLVTGCLGAGLLCFSTATRADTDSSRQARQEIQQLMERVNDAYNRQDLVSYMATHDKDYMTTNVMGQKTRYLQVQNGITKGIAQKHRSNLHYTIQSCTVHGSQAKGIVAEHFVDQQTTYSPKWIAVRNALEVITWRKDKGGWHMAATQMIRDVETFQRI